MKSTFVFTTANCRLQADIIMIRLRRAGISIDRVSAIFPRHLAPNTFFFWLRRPRLWGARPQEKGGFFATGRLERMLGRMNALDRLPVVLGRLGVAEAAANRLVQFIRWGRPMICIQAKNADEVAVAWHVLKHARADDIVISGETGSDRSAAVIAA